LAESKSAIQPSMASILQNLLSVTKVAIISWGKYEQFVKQVLDKLLPGTNFENLFLFPTCGAAFYRYESGLWHSIYEQKLSTEDIQKIFQALKEWQNESWVVTEWPFYGEQIENRWTQVSWSALGQQCPSEIKSKWDPDQKKRLSMLPHIQKKIPEFEVRIWGATTIDVTRKWIDKKYGIYQMEKYLWIWLQDMLFIGDAIFPGGNDYAAVEVWIDYIKTLWPHNTESILEQILSE
jgi:hypothetical protein